MSDYDKSKCSGGSCNMKDNCYRFKPFLDVSTEKVTWYIKPPFNEQDNSCEMFIDNLHHHTIGH